MRALFWNIRGFGTRGRRDQLRDLNRDHFLDIICLQETKKVSFSLPVLDSVGGVGRFCWNWLAAVGSPSGILVEIWRDVFDVGAVSVGTFFYLGGDYFCDY